MPDALAFLMDWIAPVLLSGLIAGLAWRAGALARSGAMAAVCVGSLAWWAGWQWALFLGLWFVMASLAPRVMPWSSDNATRSVHRVVAKGDARDAWQVLANGGVFAALAGVSVVQHTVSDATSVTTAGITALAAAAALTAAGADTLATEAGTRLGGAPWSLRTGTQVPAGTSGAVSVAGTAALAVTALLLASLAVAIGLVPPIAVLPTAVLPTGVLPTAVFPGGVTPSELSPSAVAPSATSRLVPIALVAIAGMGGAFVDTLIGAWRQQERWCGSCGESTEQRVHVCGTATTVYRGWPWLTNDGVNLLCTLTGALLAATLAWRWQLI